MRRGVSKRTACALAVLVTAVAPGVLAQDGPWALTNARIETVTRGVIERGTVVIRDGLIAAVGADVAPPADARVLDLTGRTVYPGIIDLTSTLGLPSLQAGGLGGGQGGGGQGAGVGQAAGGFLGLEPERAVASEFRPSAADVRSARDAGLTSVLVAPGRGAFRGQSALVPLRDSVAERDFLRSPVALHMGFQGTPGGGGGGGGGASRYPATLLGVIAYERQGFYDARRQARLLERYRTNPRGMARPSADASVNALVPVVEGRLPVFFAASNENEIRRALAMGREFDLQVTVVGATEGFRAVDALRAARRPVIVSVDYPQSPQVTGWEYRGALREAPDSAAADSALRRAVEGNAAALHRAGVRFALASGGSIRAPEFLANVRKAVAAGLPRDTALAALTIRAAEIAGAGEQLGSIEAGKIANLVVTEGDLLGDSGKVRLVFVDGYRYSVEAPAPGGAGGRVRAAAGARGATSMPGQVGGTWDIVINAPQGTQPATMTANQTATAFSGTMSTQFGSADISGGSIEGQRLTWSITLTIGGQAVTVAYTADVEGNRMTGTVAAGEFGSFPFTGEKRP